VPVAELIVFQNNKVPVSYQPPQGRDVGGLEPVERVRGRACQRGVSVPILTGLGVRSSSALSVAWANGAFEAALADARRDLPPEAVLYDVRADLNLRMIMTVYRELCLELDAAVAMPVSAPSPGADAAAVPDATTTAPPLPESPPRRLDAAEPPPPVATEPPPRRPLLTLPRPSRCRTAELRRQFSQRFGSSSSSRTRRSLPDSRMR
jgi:hypothetical protein